ncbi:hypothetical protein [Kitasatospora viridis]|uniref:Uncharacterized protein n=1 Tax=Kitasatospora viridis TaxID=281105 RepID=A0A561SE32_9ACTN|nr:hypothetical protein [Kitasatospora viridis]TWF73121.1 hypothetical protein FHX73_16272 [Kitasatospora viridis]
MTDSQPTVPDTDPSETGAPVQPGPGTVRPMHTMVPEGEPVDGGPQS